MVAKMGTGQDAQLARQDSGNRRKATLKSLSIQVNTLYPID